MSNTDPQTSSPEETPAPGLPAEQLRHMTQYITGAADHGHTMASYESAVRLNASIAEQNGQDPVIGEISVTAAAVGSLTRDRGTLYIHGSALTQKMVDRLGLDPAQATVFFDMQKQVALRPDNAPHTSDALSHGLGILAGMENGGEDVTKARVAVLSSAFAATTDGNLRSQTYTSLSNI